jgi:hypothetical protein
MHSSSMNMSETCIVSISFLLYLSRVVTEGSGLISKACDSFHCSINRRTTNLYDDERGGGEVGKICD